MKWRAIFTDSESLTGVAPICPEQATATRVAELLSHADAEQAGA